MKKFVVFLAFLGLFFVSVDVQAASLNDKTKLNTHVVANHHGGPGGPRGGGHSRGGHRGGGPAMKGHHGGGHVRPHGGPSGVHRPSHHGPRPIVHHSHPRPHRVGRHVPPPPPRHRFYVGSGVVRYPYYMDCINPLGYYDPYYCGMYYSPAVIRYSTPSMGFSVAF